MASEEPVYYRIHSMVRRVQTRIHRYKAAGRHRFVQRLAGGEITVRRARPATVSAEQVARHLEELKAGVAAGRYEIRTMRGEVVDLNTMKALAPAPAPVKKPEPPLDSAANDKTFPAGVGEVVVGQEDLPDPTVTPPLSEEGEEPVEAGSDDPAKVRKRKRAKQDD